MTDKTTADSSSPHLLLLYGTQTGTAEELAERAARTLRRRHLQVRVLAMDAYDRVCLIQ